MSLTEQLSAQAAQYRAQLPDEVLEKMARTTADLAVSGIVDRSLKAGDRASNFTLPNAVGKDVQLSELLADGPVVLSFYRGQWCPYCNLELRALQEALPDITAAGANLVAISPQTPDRSLSTVEKNELTFEVLSDVGNRVARQYGLVFTLPEELRPIYASFGIDVPAHNGDETFELPLAATYVIAPNGIIAHAFINADYKQRLEPANIIAVLKALAVAA
ncbi:peroxiredoxin-like family protein [Synechococcus sp. PCC 7336]|uniref:peroxiredoxin-like family protein n=1 Tax=Synechococcus sp. PCC 7336 TaxID=195250 RepID=UPI00034DA7F0|nr:peroxiredoxin-like family protein [Synechococcus sp. PCC 7336]